MKTLNQSQEIEPGMTFGCISKEYVVKSVDKWEQNATVESTSTGKKYIVGFPFLRKFPFQGGEK